MPKAYRSEIIVSFGDCAITGNVTALRNSFGNPESFLQSCYQEAADIQNHIPHEPGIVPVLLDRVIPVHNVVEVDVYLPGCPPNANIIRAALENLLMGEVPHFNGRTN